MRLFSDFFYARLELIERITIIAANAHKSGVSFGELDTLDYYAVCAGLLHGLEAFDNFCMRLDHIRLYADDDAPDVWSDGLNHAHALQKWGCAALDAIIARACGRNLNNGVAPPQHVHVWISGDKPPLCADDKRIAAIGKDF